MIALASHTGWSLGEILDMEMDNFLDWLQALPQPSKENRGRR